MKKRILFISCILSLLGGISSSCLDYLDVVPEGVPSMDNAFSNRTNAEKYLFTCYSYLPDFDHPNTAPGYLAGDECWTIPKGTGGSRIGTLCWEIGRGTQNSNSPQANYWDGYANFNNSMFAAIRDCNIFLENIHKPQDLEDYERTQWVAEVTFLKAYYHYYLLKCYGPIPIVDTNIDVNAGIDAVRQHRAPVDEVANYIAATIDKCVEDLPLTILNEGLDLGRITQPIALAVKAKALLFVASPLMNGNPDYANVVDNRGVNLFAKTADPKKWEVAAQAIKKAIEVAEEAEHTLYHFEEYLKISETTRTILSIGEAVTEKWNKEIIWGATTGSYGIQQLSLPKMSSINNHWQAFSLLAPTLTVAEEFYSSNGVPIEEDNSAFWASNYVNRYTIMTVPDVGDNKYKLEIGGKTAVLNVNREPRFYANLGFDRGSWYVAGLTNDTTAAYKLHALRGEYSGMIGSEDYSISGYYAKKVCSYKSVVSKDNISIQQYAFPIIRLADLYLMYSEALNETLSAPNEEVYHYVDIVRERAGLKGVVESWTNFSKYPNKVSTKEGMREIIHKERLNELALEGQRFWDLRRWKKELPRQIKGWNVKGNTPETYYRVTTLFERPTYTYKDYLWPIKEESIQKNPNLVQNPGWW